MMDSLTRFALAQREIGLAAGEPPTTRGYPPSVFALLAQAGRTGRPQPAGKHHRLLHRARRGRRSERADRRRRARPARRPHLALAQARLPGHYPAIDVLESLSRLMPEVTADEHRQAAQVLRELLAAYRDHEDLISIGAYRRGSNPTRRRGHRNAGADPRLPAPGASPNVPASNSAVAVARRTPPAGCPAPGGREAAPRQPDQSLIAEPYGQVQVPPGHAAEAPTSRLATSAGHTSPRHTAPRT